MKKIQSMSGDLLLYFYLDQIVKGRKLDQLNFNTSPGNYSYSGPKEVLDIAQNNVVFLHKGLSYLKDKNFIDYKILAVLNYDETIMNINLTAMGIDIIEGVEKDEISRNNFTTNFNINLSNNIMIESLMKNELGSLIKLGLF